MSLVIAERRLALDIDQIIDAINHFDMTIITAEKAELLTNDFLPTEDETELLKKKHFTATKMQSIDNFLFRLSTIPRLHARLALFIRMETLHDNLKDIFLVSDIVVAGD